MSKPEIRAMSLSNGVKATIIILVVALASLSIVHFTGLGNTQSSWSTTQISATSVSLSQGPQEVVSGSGWQPNSFAYQVLVCQGTSVCSQSSVTFKYLTAANTNWLGQFSVTIPVTLTNGFLVGQTYSISFQYACNGCGGAGSNIVQSFGVIGTFVVTT